MKMHQPSHLLSKSLFFIEKGGDAMNNYNITCDVRTGAKKRKEVMPMQNQGEFAYCVRRTHVPWSTLYA